MSIISFDRRTWAQGTRGVLDAGQVDQAFIRDMHLYPSGLLGPRPWLRHHPHLYLQLTGLANGNWHGIAVVPNYWHPAEGMEAILRGSQLLLLTSDATHRIQATARPQVDPWTVLTVGGATMRQYDDNLPEGNMLPRFDVDKRGDTHPGGIYLGPQYLMVRSSSTWVPYHIGYNAGVSLSVFGIDPLGRSTIHQGRMFWYGTTSPTNLRNRIYFSDAHRYDTFSSSAQFFDVDGEVEGLYSLGSSLYIWTRDGRWFVLQGRGNPADATLIFLGFQKIPLRTDSVVVHDGSLLFIPSDRTGIVRVTGENFDEVSLAHLAPSRFSQGDRGGGFATNKGVAATQWDFLALTYANGPGPPTEDWYNGMRSFAKYRNMWVNEDYFNGSGRLERQEIVVDDQNGIVYLADSATHGSDTFVRVYTRDIYLGRPSRDDDRWSDSTENRLILFGPSSGQSMETALGGFLGLPRITTEIYGTMRTVKVAVDGRYWRTIDGLNDRYGPLRMHVRVRDSDNGVHLLHSHQNLDALPSSDIHGRPFRFVFSGALPATRWNDVWIEEVRGIAIEAVHVDVDHRLGRPTV